MRMSAPHSIFVSVLLSLFVARAASAEERRVSLGWLGDQPPRVTTGISWGVPWPKGTVQPGESFALLDGGGKALPLQSWPLATWPDGSMKWSGFATVAGPEVVGELTLSAGASEVPPPTQSVSVEDAADAVRIDTGAVQAVLPKSGEALIGSLTVDGREVARLGRLVCQLQDGPQADVGDTPPVSPFAGTIQSVTVEQSGPVRAVVRIDGMHKQAVGERTWLPFRVRLYFYAGAAPIRMVHTITYDGDEHRDFIRGLGIAFDVPLREEIQNRHVRFGGEGNGLWAEPIEPLIGWRGRVTVPGIGDVYEEQVAGRRIPNRDELNGRSQAMLDGVAEWNDYRLMQPNAGGFTIEKRTGAHGAWIDAAAGGRASGLVFAGDVSGGLGVAAKDFWQSYPKSLEIRNMRGETAELRVWLWAPQGPAMDVRHYDDHAQNFDFTYEDVEMEMATPMGVARTHELTLLPSAEAPAREASAAQALDGAAPPLLAASPQYLHDARAFGIWSLPDRSTPFKRAVEGRLDAGIAYYQTEIDQRNWYGFWNYGDVMHGYDPERHMWRYDIGGFAWDNSEQGTDMWLWYSFLRTGRADIFRMAEAMTRHTGEVDFHHIGPYAGLGSRHNVRHWGDGAKEVRISMAPYRRFHYYLTTDERTGDIMRDALQADETIKRVDPMRKADPPVPGDEKFAARIRGGPDLFAFLGNWMTEWERTGDTKWRDKIMNAVNSVAELPYWFKTGENLLWGFDPESGKVFARDPEPGGYNLVTNMGGPELMLEFCDHLDDEKWNAIWLQYCRLAGASDPDLLLFDQMTGAEGIDGSYAGGGKIAAYAYYRTGVKAFAERALGTLNRLDYFDDVRRIDGPDAVKPIDEGPTRLVTNDNNNFALHAIQILEMCADQLPEEVPPARQAGGRGGFGFGGPGGGFGGPPDNEGQ
jgi:hypothetical protein